MKLLQILLTSSIILILISTGCINKEDDEDPGVIEPPSDVLFSLCNHVDKGEYEEAYALLLDRNGIFYEDHIEYLWTQEEEVEDEYEREYMISNWVEMNGPNGENSTIFNMSIFDIKQLEYSTDNSGPVYEIIFVIDMIDRGEEIESNGTYYVGKNIQNDKYGVFIDGYNPKLEPDKFEVDDDFKNATTLLNAVSKNHSLHLEEDEDWFVFEIGPLSGFDINVYSDVHFGTKFFVYSEEGVPDDEIGTSYDTSHDVQEGHSKLERHESQGIYYVKVVSNYGDRRIRVPNYEISIVAL